METVELDLDKLKPYSNNAKNHPDEQVELIANSIKAFGFRTPIVVDENFVIIQGHGRRLASLSLGLKTVPCVIADDLSKEQVKMLRLADNKVAESDWDLETLDFELLDLSDDFNIGDFGFEFDEDEDFSDKNAEINTDDYADEMELKFKLSYSEYELANEKLKEIASTPENALKILLKMEL